MFKALLPILGLVFGIISCHNVDYMPKPHGYYRIDLPERVYREVGGDGCPFRFEAPLYSQLKEDQSPNAKLCWKNLDFPQFNARLHISYSPLNAASPLGALTEDARTFAFKHTTKATAIDQRQVHLPAQQVYGLEYSIKGNTASNYQFYVSDSLRHYLRGALYFNEKPNLDSIQPVLDFLTEDIKHLIHTFRWE